MFQIAGGSVGLGLTTTVFTSGIHTSLADDVGASVPDRSQNAIHGILAGTDSAKQALSDFTTKSADQVLQIVREAFAAGFHSALLLDAALAFVGFLIALFFVGRPVAAAGARGARPRAPPPPNRSRPDADAPSTDQPRGSRPSVHRHSSAPIVSAMT